MLNFVGEASPLALAVFRFCQRADELIICIPFILFSLINKNRKATLL